MSRPCVVGPAPLTLPHACSRPGPCPPASHSVRTGNHDSAGASPPAMRPARRPPRKPEPRTRHTSRDNSARVQSRCPFCGICSAGREKATLETSRTCSQCACGWRLPSISSGLSRALHAGPSGKQRPFRHSRLTGPKYQPEATCARGLTPGKPARLKFPEEALLVRAPGLRAPGRAPRAPHSITCAPADFNRRASHPWLEGAEPMGPWI